MGRGPAQGPRTSGEALTFRLNFPSSGVTTALLTLHMGKQEVLRIIPPKEYMLGATPGPNSASSLVFWLPVQFDQNPFLHTHLPWLLVALSTAFQAHSALTSPMPE